MGGSGEHLALKIVIRVADFEASRRFYVDVIGLPILEEWDEPQGRGCIVGFGLGGAGGALEIYAMRAADPRHDPAFGRPLTNDKIDIQLRVPSLDTWLARFDDRWHHTAPETLPWGQRSVQLRDPDNLLIAVYEDAPARSDDQSGAIEPERGR